MTKEKGKSISQRKSVTNEDFPMCPECESPLPKNPPGSVLKCDKCGLSVYIVSVTNYVGDHKEYDTIDEESWDRIQKESKDFVYNS